VIDLAEVNLGEAVARGSKEDALAVGREVRDEGREEPVPVGIGIVPEGRGSGDGNSKHGVSSKDVA
jgi:hypothetical protein